MFEGLTTLTRQRLVNQRSRRSFSPELGFCSGRVSLTMRSTSFYRIANQRQSGLPFSNWFVRIRVIGGAPLPVNSILASLCICIIIALLNLGGRRIFNSIVGLLTGTLGLTYALSIGCVLWRRCYGAPLPPARWSLGRWGVPLNIIALLYMLTSSIISFFPIFNGSTAADMNWLVLDFVNVVCDIQLTKPYYDSQV